MRFLWKTLVYSLVGSCSLANAETILIISYKGEDNNFMSVQPQKSFGMCLSLVEYTRNKLIGFGKEPYIVRCAQTDDVFLQKSGPDSRAIMVSFDGDFADFEEFSNYDNCKNSEDVKGGFCALSPQTIAY